MKKALLKIGIIAALAFSVTLFKQEPYQFLRSKIASYVVVSSEDYRSYHRMLFLKHENAKVHFIGLKNILSSIKTFQKDFFINAIYSHPLYVGSLDNITSDKEDQIYDFVDSEGNLHFYFQHSNGTRHFSLRDVKIGNEVACQIENATIGHYYPSLESFLECTLA